MCRNKQTIPLTTYPGLIRLSGKKKEDNALRILPRTKETLGILGLRLVFPDCRRFLLSRSRGEVMRRALLLTFLRLIVLLSFVFFVSILGSIIPGFPTSIIRSIGLILLTVIFVAHIYRDREESDAR